MATVVDQKRAALGLALKSGKLTMDEFLAESAKLDSETQTAPPADKKMGVATESKTNMPAPLKRAEFVAKAPVIEANIGGASLQLCEARQLSTGNCGYILSGKVTIMIDGKPIKFQVSGSVVAINSKLWPS